MSDRKAQEIGIVILAAGKGTRLKLPVSKPLAPICGRKLIDFPILCGSRFLTQNAIQGHIGVVVGHEGDQLKKHIKENYDNEIDFALQKKQLGTADALKSYFRDCPWAKNCNYTLVMCSDTPLLKESDLSVLWTSLKNKNLDGVAASFFVDNPKGYGRILRFEHGFKIIEEKDTTEKEKQIKEVNSALYFLKTSFVLEGLKKIDSNNQAGEFYLTDLFQENSEVESIMFEDGHSFLGVNDLEQLENAEISLYKRKAENLRKNGVRFIDSKTSYIEDSVEIGEGSLIYPYCSVRGKSIIGKNVVLNNGVIIESCSLEDDCNVKAYSFLEKSLMKKESSAGPFARLRIGTELGEKSKIGNFVETKQSVIGKKAAISHLSYVGDAEVGENTNIGCGFITCNYDGGEKHKTLIGKNAFIGSDTQLIAPINVGDSAYIASGSTINKDVPKGAFSIARGKQIIKEGMASRFHKGKWSEECKKES